jgi:hypothetical protein
MELEGAKGCFDFLLTVAGLTIPVFISDRHHGITKWIRESHPAIQHFFDQWHIAKGIVKKMLAASKEKGCEQIGEWTRAVRNHVYWCSTSTVKGFGNMILAKWKSFMRHVSNKHDHHPDTLFPKCAHDELESQRKWIKVGMSKATIYCSLFNENKPLSPLAVTFWPFSWKTLTVGMLYFYKITQHLGISFIGTRAYDKMQGIIMKTSLLSGVKKLSPDAQTSSLEGFHSTLNQWHPKMICFSWLGTYCRCFSYMSFPPSILSKK